MEILNKLKQTESKIYPVEAYFFLFEALEATYSLIGERKHISGQQLIDGIRHLAIRKFGYLAKFVFNQWGIDSYKVWGEIVFQMVEAGLLSKREEDSEKDFLVSLTFNEFEENFLKESISTE